MNYPSLDKYLSQMEKCAKCGDCAYAVKLTTSRKPISMPCAVRNVLGFEAYDARGRIIVMKNLLQGKIEADEKFLDWLYTCTTCANCKETCLAVPDGIDTPSMVEAMRKDAVAQGLTLDKHLTIKGFTQNQHNPYGEPHSKRREFLRTEKLPSKGKVSYFVGCTTSYRQQDVARATVKLLKHAGVDFAMLGDEWCCGSVHLRLGYEELAREVMEHNLDEIDRAGSETVVTTCSGCYRALKDAYRSLESSEGSRIKILHITELLDQLAEKGKISFSAKKLARVTYHDPCHLGRHGGVYEAPRRLIERVKGAQLVEMKTNRSYAHCCGAGGGVKSTHPNLATQVARQRIGEALEVNSDLLLTACPFCKTNLSDASNDLIRVQDVVEYLADSLSTAPGPNALPVQQLGASELGGADFQAYLGRHPEIFVDLVKDSILDFAYFRSWNSFDKGEKPIDVFNVKRTESGIEIKLGRAERADVALNFSPDSVRDLVASANRDEYAKKFGRFYNEPTEDKWIDFILNKSTKTLIRMGYGKFAREAGILQEEE
ncbi:MAG: (Fe-S)-binding protein [Promethearchaeati archaeon SRVP18_Atabeyarchaeia-1]